MNNIKGLVIHELYTEVKVMSQKYLIQTYIFSQLEFPVDGRFYGDQDDIK